MCSYDDQFDEAVEVCCGICDGLKGYATTSSEMARLNRTGCGCDGAQGQEREETFDEFRARMQHNKCDCPTSYSMCRIIVIWNSKFDRLDGTRNGTNGGVGHGGWTGYGNQLEGARA